MYWTLVRQNFRIFLPWQMLLDIHPLFLKELPLGIWRNKLKSKCTYGLLKYGDMVQPNQMVYLQLVKGVRMP